MPPKTKVAVAKANNPESKVTEPTPKTVDERTTQRFYQTNPVERRFEEVGFPDLTAQEKKAYTYTKLILPVADHKVPLSNKSEREYWKQVTKDGLPIRRLKKGYTWGQDRSGRDIGTYKLGDFEQRSFKSARLSALDILHRQFLSKRRQAFAAGNAELSDQDISEEKIRRKEMAALKRELYGEITGSLANDPEWDDVIPIPHSEPNDALAKIAYPDDYAEGGYRRL
ncbi:CAAX geranylgeranyltransferase alpha subunit [Conoideocrella luteorostrata]|uniref:CAAX geranylgeranyltransferase alpha subunit n=1 Tax=Conoideocrella luteorostrata TaxID=1105319 RepID=A0AAJ0G114_9HYPO|nr:CAAX geranylgeranyltransferase alpha subunit [Conoideocrella luteorostrata]